MNQVIEPSTVTIRPIEPGDFVNVTACCVELSGLIPGLEEGIMSGRIQGLVAIVRGLCVGCIAATLDCEDSFAGLNPFPMPQVQLLFIEVNRLYRSRGIGRMLMDTFIEKMKEKGVGCIFFKLFKTQRARLGFFEKLGFQVVRRERNGIILKRNVWSDFGVVDADDAEFE